MKIDTIKKANETVLEIENISKRVSYIDQLLSIKKPISLLILDNRNNEKMVCNKEHSEEIFTSLNVLKNELINKKLRLEQIIEML